jgi:hypothetical protein
MKNEAFVEEMKVGFGVLVLELMRSLFVRIIRRLTVLVDKLESALEKRLQQKMVANTSGDTVG